jgi:hypothetical protein
MPWASEDTWAKKRLATREEAVNAVKRHCNYKLLLDAGCK